MLDPKEQQDNLNQINMSDSQFNQYILKFDEENVREESDIMFQTQSQLQPLIYSTLDLDYNISLNEEELKFYKSLLVEKENKIKQLNQKYTKRNSKAISLIEGLKRLDKKIKEVSEGYKHLSGKYQQSLNNEKMNRNRRLQSQQKKNHLYKKLCELQSVHMNYINDINSYEKYDEQYNEICQQNERMQQQIQRLQNHRKEVYEGGDIISRKQELKNQIKKLYEKIKLVEKQEEQIIQQYQTKRKKLKALEKEQAKINSKNVQISTLISRINKLREECKDASFAKMELQNQYRGLLSEQSLLKRTIKVENQANSPKKKQNQEKTKVVHNFKIIDTEGDEELKFNSRNRSSSKHQSNSLQSLGQLDDLINRFQKIKSKSKTNI